MAGNCLGAVHAHCNINAKQRLSSIVTIAMLNLTEYGSRLLYKELINRKDHSVPFESVPKTDESYMSLSYGRVSCIDSSTFMNEFRYNC